MVQRKKSEFDIPGLDSCWQKQSKREQSGQNAFQRHFQADILKPSSLIEDNTARKTQFAAKLIT